MQTAACTTPNAPDGLIATGADSQVTVTWNSVSGVSSYNVYWSTNLSSATALSTMTKIDGIAASPYTHTGRTNNTAYYYRVTSVTGNCESAASSLVNATPSATNATTGGGTSTTGSGTGGTGTGGSGTGGSSTVTTAPSAPTNVTAAAADGQVTLSWDAASGATSYKVYVGTATGVTISNATISASTTVTSLTQTGLTNGATYYFIVTASNSAGESAASSEASAMPVAAATAPAAPSGVAATAGDTQVTITWAAVTGATSYTVYYGTSTGVTAANATGNATATVASLTKTGLTNSTTYYFIVTATNAVGESAVSSEASATPAKGSIVTHSTLTTGLVSYWKLDSNSVDYVGTRNGTDTSVTYSVGKVGNAAVYSGASNTAFSDAGLPSGNAARSVSLWAKMNSIATDQTFWGYGTVNSNTNYFAINYYNVAGNYLRIVGWGNDVNTNYTLSSGTWYHIVVTFDGTTTKVYVTNALVSSNAMTYNTILAAGKIGDYTGGNAQLDGSVDEVGVWNRALTAGEVADLYNAGVGLLY